jgi:ssDNA-specific exonuclease RecJ
MEIKKSAMYRFLKKQAKLDKQISEAELQEIEALLDQLINEAESE